jgi:hypothetical protein
MWHKLGLIFAPQGHADWFVSHAALPIADHLEGDAFRVYFSGRDSEGRSQIGFFDFRLAPPYPILQVSDQPIISFGQLGTFDDRGVTASCLIKHDGRLYHYYSGWSLGVTVPFYFYIGLAVADQEVLAFERVSQAPIMDRHAVDPFILGAPFILIDDGLWRMWYVSAINWEMVEGKPKHNYLVKYAESTDGLNWHRTNRICIDFASEDEYALSRPFVLKEDGIYKMWYAYRGESYRIGYAESRDGLEWERKDSSVGIDVSEDGWDSEMIEYPFIFDHRQSRYMLYNGNDYGRTGIGLAVWAE